MEEDSDKFIIENLKSYAYPLNNKTSLAKINGDDLLVIILSFFEKMGFDLKKFHLKDSSQKFRIATKIVDELNKSYGFRTDCNALLNPTLSDLRKILVFIVSKEASNAEEEGAGSKYETLNDKIQETKEKSRQVKIKAFLKEEWLHPLISSRRFNSFRSLENLVDLLHPDRFKSHLLLEGYEGSIRKNAGILGSLSRKILLSEAARKRNEQTSLDDKLFIARRRKAKEKELRDLENILAGNEEEWENLKNLNKAAKMLRKKQKEEEEELNQELELLETTMVPAQTMFNLELVYKEETAVSVLGAGGQESGGMKEGQSGEEGEGMEGKTGKQAEIMGTSNNESETNNQSGNEVLNKLRNLETDIEAIKMKNKEEMEGLRSKLEDQEKKIEKIEQKRQFYEEDNTRIEEEIQKMKEFYRDLQKKAENLHNFLRNLEVQERGEKDLESENRELEKEIEQIETEWETHREEMRKAIHDFEEQVENKREKFNQIRDKLKQYDEDYEKLNNDIRSNQTQVESLQVEFSKTQKDVNRQLYIKKISDINANFKKQKTDFGKINVEVKELENSIDFYQQSMQRQFTEIENMMMMDFKKSEKVTQQIQKMYQDYKQVIETTMKNLLEQGKKKVESKQLEVKIDVLNTKNYKGSLEKMQLDLQEIKKENEALYKKLKDKQ